MVSLAVYPIVFPLEDGCIGVALQAPTQYFRSRYYLSCPGGFYPVPLWSILN
jgi:hypothetical protein